MGTAPSNPTGPREIEKIRRKGPLGCDASTQYVTLTLASVAPSYTVAKMTDTGWASWDIGTSYEFSHPLSFCERSDYDFTMGLFIKPNFSDKYLISQAVIHSHAYGSGFIACCTQHNNVYFTSNPQGWFGVKFYKSWTDRFEYYVAAITNGTGCPQYCPNPNQTFPDADYVSALNQEV